MAHGRGDAANAAGEHVKKEKHGEIEIHEIQSKALIVFRRGAFPDYTKEENSGCRQIPPEFLAP